jgi:HEAT repeat protein
MESAVVEALRSAFEVLPREELRAELAFGDRLSRAAALAHGAGRLANTDLPLVLKAVDEQDELINRCALQALSQFGDDAAIERLLTVARGGPAELRSVAVASLAGSRFPAAHEALSGYLAEATPEARLTIIGILAQYPRPVWSELIFADAHAEDAELRLAAVRALVQVGHSQLFDVLAEALQSEDAPLRDEAFARLVDRTDSKSEQLATEYALKLLAESPPSNPVISILSRTRDPRAIPLLLKHLDAATENRQQLINLVATVGGHDVVPELVARYAKYEDQDRAATLESLRQLGAAEARPLALEALTSKQPAVMAVAANLLASDPEEESTALLAAALEHTEDAYAASSICNALAAIGNAEARQALVKARDSQDGNKRSYALSALQRIKFSSMAWHYTSQAQEPMRVANEHLAAHRKALDDSNAELAEQEQKLATAEFEKAGEWLELALSFDPEFAEAYSRRGHIRLIQEKLDEAKADFQKAVELDDYDSIGVTGLAIIEALQGNYAKAVADIEAAKGRFVDDAMFEYNAACVYGRALQAVAKDDESDERNAAMQQYREAGIAHLKRSMELGFSDLDHVRNDPDLEAFHDQPAFQELMNAAPQTEEEKKAGANAPALQAVPAQVQEIQIQVEF